MAHILWLRHERPDVYRAAVEAHAETDLIVQRMKHPDLGLVPRVGTETQLIHGNVGISFAMRTSLVREHQFIAGPPLAVAELGGAVLLVFPAERFDLDVAAALGKRDWDAVLRRGDVTSGAIRDRIQRDGAGWVAPLEFLSEVFLDGKPLAKPAFEAGARAIATGGRALDVHFPRFGPVVLLEVPGKGRFVTSLREHADAVAALVGR